MGAILQSLGRTVIAGIVVLVVIVLIVGQSTGAWVNLASHAWWTFFMRWLHVLSGVMWIGLLWYFNFVQTPSMPKIPDEHKPAISKVIAPEALFWFRWAALATIVTGLILFHVIIKLTVGLRASREEEFKGLDIEEHGSEAYPKDVVGVPGIAD